MTALAPVPAADIRLADIEQAVRERRDFAVFEAAYLHRAAIEDAIGTVKGRDRVRAARMAASAEEPAGPVRIRIDMQDMIVFETEQGWCGHRWVRREGGRILAETEILDGAARAQAIGIEARDVAARRIGAAHPVHPPLGELRAGRGQLATSPSPLLPPDFPNAARPAAQYLHRVWNARAFDRVAARWTGPAEAGGDAAAFLLRLFTQLPDAELMIERALVDADRTALLWRLHGHHANGRRARAIGSSVLTLSGEAVVAEEMMIDALFIQAARYQPLIDLSPTVARPGQASTGDEQGSE
jgi:hypothetical protein